MPDEFRQAKMIELHDSGVVLVVKGHNDGSVGWREFNWQSGESFRVNGTDIENIAKAFNLTIGDYPVIRAGKQAYERWKDRELYINRCRIVIGDSEVLDDIECGQLINQLWANAKGPGLLEIKAVFWLQRRRRGNPVGDIFR